MTGVPHASASSAASPNVSTGLGARYSVACGEKIGHVLSRALKGPEANRRTGRARWELLQKRALSNDDERRAVAPVRIAAIRRSLFPAPSRARVGRRRRRAARVPEGHVSRRVSVARARRHGAKVLRSTPSGTRTVRVTPAPLSSAAADSDATRVERKRRSSRRAYDPSALRMIALCHAGVGERRRETRVVERDQWNARAVRGSCDDPRDEHRAPDFDHVRTFVRDDPAKRPRCEEKAVLRLSRHSRAAEPVPSNIVLVGDEIARRRDHEDVAQLGMLCDVPALLLKVGAHATARLAKPFRDVEHRELSRPSSRQEAAGPTRFESRARPPPRPARRASAHRGPTRRCDMPLRSCGRAWRESGRHELGCAHAGTLAVARHDSLHGG